MKEEMTVILEDAINEMLVAHAELSSLIEADVALEGCDDSGKVDVFNSQWLEFVKENKLILLTALEGYTTTLKMDVDGKLKTEQVVGA